MKHPNFIPCIDYFFSSWYKCENDFINEYLCAWGDQIIGSWLHRGVVEIGVHKTSMCINNGERTFDISFLIGWRNSRRIAKIYCHMNETGSILTPFRRQPFPSLPFHPRTNFSYPPIPIDKCGTHSLEDRWFVYCTILVYASLKFKLEKLFQLMFFLLRFERKGGEIWNKKKGGGKIWDKVFLYFLHFIFFFFLLFDKLILLVWTHRVSCRGQILGCNGVMSRLRNTTLKSKRGFNLTLAQLYIPIYLYRGVRGGVEFSETLSTHPLREIIKRLIFKPGVSVTFT